MKTSTFITAALAGSALAGPIKKRTYDVTDAGILNYALTLEHLEDKFYREGLANFTEYDFKKAGFDETFYTNLKEISYDESTHVSFLTSALTAAGAVPVKECTYAFGVTSVEAFVATASILEGVGITAYLGAAGAISSKAYLTAAGSILTVESRHNAYLRASLDESPFPQAFDVPLDFNEVYTLAAPFIVSCPEDNPAFLSLKAFPGLSVVSKDPIKTGSSIVVQSTVTDYDGPLYASFVTVTGPVWAKISQWGAPGGYDVVVPEGVHGQSYLVLTKSETVSDDTLISGPAIVEISGSDGAPY